MKTRLVLLVLLALMLTACAPAGEQIELIGDQYVDVTYLRDGLYRVIDARWNVVCYVLQGASIDCVPLSQTGVDY